MKKIFLTVITLFSLAVFVNAQNSSPYWSLAGNSNATSSSKLGTTNGINLRFYTNNSERARITASGLVGIGTVSPTERLQVNSPSGSSAFRAQVNGYTKLLVHSAGGVSIGANATPPTNGLYVSGNVGIGTKTPSSKLHVIGNAVITSGLNVTDKGIRSDNNSGGGTGVYGEGNAYGLYGTNDGGLKYGTGVGGSGAIGVEGVGGTGVRGKGSDDDQYGEGIGVYGEGDGDGVGVKGYSRDSYGGEFSSYNSTGLVATTNTGDYAAEFIGDVSVSGTVYQTSDKNLKKNIHEFGSAMSIINKLKPKNYEFRNDGKYASLNLPKGNHYGLIAQELEEVLPHLVKESRQKLESTKLASLKPTADGKPAIVAQQKEAKESINIKAVNYTELIPIIIKAMQEQQVIIQEQQATIEEQIAENKEQNATIEALTQLVNKLSLNPNTPGSVKLIGASLGQSTPNPASINTRISYNIPTGFSRAELVINNEAGQKVKQMQLNKSGLIDIDTSRLSAGTYFYTLYVNGASVDTKKKVVVRY